MSEDTTRYVRNRRPNSLNIRVGGRQSYNARLNIQLGRRGTRSDSLALSDQDFKSSEIQRHLRQNNIEEISAESFMTLSERVDGGEENLATPDEQEQRSKTLKKRSPDANLNVSVERNAETVVPEFQPESMNYHKKVEVSQEARARSRALMSPSLEYVEEPKPTDKELAAKTRRSRKPAAK